MGLGVRISKVQKAMSDVSMIKAWSKSDVADTIRSLYFAAKSANQYSPLPENEKKHRWLGSLDGWSAILLYIGVNPNTVFSEDDLQFMAEMKKRR